MAGKILFVASTRSHILSFHLPYLEALHREGFQIHGAWGGTEGDVPFVDRITYLPFKKQMTSPKNFLVSKLLRRQLRDENYDCVIVHTSLAAFFTRLAILGLKNRPKVINMAHGYLFDDQTSLPKRMILLAAEKLTAHVTDLLITMNEWDYQAAQKHRLGRAIVKVPGIGVDFPRLDRQSADCSVSIRQVLWFSDDDFLLIYPAEFSQRKSQHVLLRALVELPEHVKLVLPGSGILLEECKALAAELNVAHRVAFPGYITEMGPWYRCCNAAVSASRIEGLPFNIMEAMYYGLPIVATAVKGHEDLISDGVSGLLYPYGDYGACAKQICRFLDDSAFAAALAQSARQSMDQYALQEVFPRVMALYHSVLPVPSVV